MSKLNLGLSTALSVTALCLAASAQTFTSSVVASGISNPVFVTSPPGDFNRLFVVEQNTGRIEIIQGGTLLATPFVTVTGLSAFGERGLLGLAFHPDFANNGEFFVHYTASGGGHSRVAKYTVSGNPLTNNVANPGGDVILAYNQPFPNHNAGMIAFGPDGYLYVATGDGGSGGDPGDRAQNPANILGKMLRIDVDGDDFPADSLRDYAIPPGQPNFGATGIPELWQIGLRNPWRFSFDKETGDMWIGDVGQNAREEVNFAPAGVGGQNWGWRCREGVSCHNNSSSFCSCATPTLLPPIYDYGWFGGASVVGGYVYRGPLDCIDGTYFFADAGSSSLLRIAEPDGMGGVTVTNVSADFAIPGGETIVSFGEDAEGNLYICDFNGGQIHRIELDAPCPIPGISQCNGDGGDQAGCTDCPCMNNAAPGTIGGCINSAGTSSRIIDSGAPSVSNDTMRFEMDGVPPSAFCVLLSGSSVAPTNMANPCFGLNSGTQAFDRDGLRCAVMGTLRHGGRSADGNGEVGVTNNGWGFGSGPIGGLLFSAGVGVGQTRHYQVTHRDDPLAGCMRGLNTSQALTVTAIP